jgi:hypothetical protein
MNGEFFHVPMMGCGRARFKSRLML